MIRQATIEDAPRIAEIHVDSWRSTYRGIVPDDFLAALDVKKREEAWKKLCSNERSPVYVACHANRIIGFCHVSASGDRDAEATAEINSIYMDPAHIRHGYGSKLLAAALSFALEQGCTVVTLWVLNENTIAKEFYRVMGFQPDGATKTEGRQFKFNEVRYRINLSNARGVGPRI